MASHIHTYRKLPPEPGRLHVWSCKTCGKYVPKHLEEIILHDKYSLCNICGETIVLNDRARSCVVDGGIIAPMCESCERDWSDESIEADETRVRNA